MIWFIFIFIFCYLIPAVVCYGIALPFIENHLKESGIDPDTYPSLERRSLWLSLLGPIGLWIIIKVEERLYAFRFTRRYK